MSNVQELMDSLESDDPQERRYAIQDLGDLRELSAVKAIAGLLSDPDTSIAEACVEALQVIKDVSVTQELLPLLESESVELRNRAMEILETYVESSSKQILEFCARSRNKDVRKFGLDILINANPKGKEHLDETISIIQKLALDSNINVAAAALELLGVYGDRRVVPLIEKRIYDDQWIQWVSLEILRALDDQDATACLSKIDMQRLDPSVHDVFNELKKNRSTAPSEKAS